MYVSVSMLLVSILFWANPTSEVIIVKIETKVDRVIHDCTELPPRPTKCL